MVNSTFKCNPVFYLTQFFKQTLINLSCQLQACYVHPVYKQVVVNSITPQLFIRTLSFKTRKHKMNKLFSYGTLQLGQVQMDTFGRNLTGQKDILRKYKINKIKITDPKVIESSGTDEHPILEYTGNDKDFVEGTLYELTDEEILKADSYEVDDYKRCELKFESGQTGYVYLKS